MMAKPLCVSLLCYAVTRRLSVRLVENLAAHCAAASLFLYHESRCCIWGEKGRSSGWSPSRELLVRPSSVSVVARGGRHSHKSACMHKLRVYFKFKEEFNEEER